MMGRSRSWCACHTARSVFALALLLSTTGMAHAQMGRIQGTVKDENGRVINGATVVAENRQAAPSSITTTVDDHGRWGMLGLRPGTWTFKASAKGYETAYGTKRIESLGTTPLLDFRLLRGPEPLSGGVLGGRSLEDLRADIGAADALLAAADYPKAIAAYRAILARIPALTSMKLRMGEAQRLEGDYDGAIATYGEIGPTDPLAADAAREIGLTWMQKGDLGRAQSILTEVAARPDAARETFLALGEVMEAQNDPVAAAGWYERAAQTDPTWPKPILKLALVAVNRGETRKASDYLGRVVALAPDSPEATQARTILEQIAR